MLIVSDVLKHFREFQKTWFRLQKILLKRRVLNRSKMGFILPESELVLWNSRTSILGQLSAIVSKTLYVILGQFAILSSVNLFALLPSVKDFIPELLTYNVS